MQSLKGRTCIFAGGCGGDGVDAVKSLCQGGMNVAIMTHQPIRARRLQEEISKCNYPGECIVVQDGNTQLPPISDEEVFRQVAERFGGIDVVVCNTGDNGGEDSIDTVDISQLMAEIEHLMGGNYHMLKCALPYLRRSAAPRVILMTSVEGARGGNRGSFVNAVARGAVLALAKNCAARLATENINVNCIQKGLIQRLETPLDSESRERMSSAKGCIPRGRIGTPQDLAGAVCFLASEEAAYLTGAVLDLSGGMSLI
ncbi:MAG: SDR family oxidoreductase [Clostridia bacterium]|nr:SDR family oxidoreductase [Clostridia bacterium]